MLYVCCSLHYNVKQNKNIIMIDELACEVKGPRDPSYLPSAVLNKFSLSSSRKKAEPAYFATLT